MKILLHLKKGIKTESGTKVKILKADNELKFTNNEITIISQNYSIRNQTIVSYIPN